MAVFADLLCGQGDPRGELVQLQLAREQKPHDARLARAEAAHLARHDRALLGGLRTATTLCELTWRRGFIVEAKLRSFAQDLAEPRTGLQPEPRRSRLPRLVRELLTLESTRRLSMLTVQLPYSTFARAQLSACVDEVVSAQPDSLRVLSVHVLEQRYDDWYSNDWSVAATVDEQVGEVFVSVDAGLAGVVLRRF
ncbi:MAG: hypothetical protein Q8N23_23925 [Archangium sp.]|nr:hypothetical protein [Archangium sp.]MDP3573984.1 hypothetical protein [Archangium sp.]